MPVVRLVAVARRALFDEPCALLSDDRELPTLMAVPLERGDAPALARVLDPWLGRSRPAREVTIDLLAGPDGLLRAVVAPVEPGAGFVPRPDRGRAIPVVDALTLSHRLRVPIRVDAGLLAEFQVDPCDVDRMVPITDRSALLPTAEQQRRLARAFSDIGRPDTGR